MRAQPRLADAQPFKTADRPKWWNAEHRAALTRTHLEDRHIPELELWFGRKRGRGYCRSCRSKGGERRPFFVLVDLDKAEAILTPEQIEKLIAVESFDDWCSVT